MRVYELIEYITEKVSLPFFGNEFPAHNDKLDCGIVRIDGGDKPDIYVVGFKSPSLQIMVRHGKGSEAERIAHEIWDLFHGKEHYSIGSTYVAFSACDQSQPVALGKDKNERTLYSVNVSCKTIE